MARIVEKILLEEPQDEVKSNEVIELDDEEEKEVAVADDAHPADGGQPAEEPTEEPAEEPKAEPDADVAPDILQGAFASMLGTEISKAYEALDSVDSMIATFKAQLPERTDIMDILSAISDERAIHIGMLQNAMYLLDGKKGSLISDGEDKADEIASEESEPESESEGE